MRWIITIIILSFFSLQFTQAQSVLKLPVLLFSEEPESQALLLTPVPLRLNNDLEFGVVGGRITWIFDFTNDLIRNANPSSTVVVIGEITTSTDQLLGVGFEISTTTAFTKLTANQCLQLDANGIVSSSGGACGGTAFTSFAWDEIFDSNGNYLQGTSTQSIIITSTSTILQLTSNLTTTTNATTTRLNIVTSFRINSDEFTDLTGTNLSVTNGVLNAASGGFTSIAWDEVVGGGSNPNYITPTSTKNILTASTTVDTLKVISTSLFGDHVTSTGNISPSADSTYDLGNPGNFWANLYVDQIEIFQTGGTNPIIESDSQTNDPLRFFYDIANARFRFQGDTNDYFEINLTGTEAVLQGGSLSYVTFGDSIQPNSDSTKDSGASSRFWDETFTDELVLTNAGTGATAANTIRLGGQDLAAGDAGLLITTENDTDYLFASLAGFNTTTPWRQLSIEGSGVITGTLDVTNLLATGTINFGDAVSFELVNGTSPTVNALGEFAFDTTDNQLIIATGTGSYVGVFPLMQKLWSATIASTSPDFISGGVIPMPSQRDGVVIREIHCTADNGTSVVINVSSAGGTLDTETLTCTNAGVSDTDVKTNNTIASTATTTLEIGTITGVVDYVSFSVWGFITRE